MLKKQLVKTNQEKSKKISVDFYKNIIFAYVLWLKLSIKRESWRVIRVPCVVCTKSRAAFIDLYQINQNIAECKLSLTDLYRS